MVLKEMMMGANRVLMLSSKAGNWERKKANDQLILTRTGNKFKSTCRVSAEYSFLQLYLVAFLLRRSILFLDILLKFQVSPVEEHFSTLTCYQQALHLDYRCVPDLF